MAQIIAPTADTPGSDVGRTCKADISITKTNTPGVNGKWTRRRTPSTGAATVPYTITVTNNGPKPANNTLITDPAPTNLVCATATCAAAGGAVCPAQTGAALVAGLARCRRDRADHALRVFGHHHAQLHRAAATAAREYAHTARSDAGGVVSAAVSQCHECIAKCV